MRAQESRQCEKEVTATQLWKPESRWMTGVFVSCDWFTLLQQIW